jgi:(p)ppGpp synthase/HD superfamily hydrolase
VYYVPYVIAAAWLHDVVEDTDASESDIKSRFGDDIFRLVMILTNPSKEHSELRRAERKKMDREHLANASDEAKAIKLADRIDNLRDLSVDPLVPENFRVRYLSESQQLLEVLRGVDGRLEDMLQGMIDRQEQVR